MLERFGLTHLADQSVYDLSGGERQLMALAVVLATDPGLLVLDEPTTLLDRRNTLRLRALLDTLPQTVVLATHDLDLAARRPTAPSSSTTGRIVFDGDAGRRPWSATSRLVDEP